MADKSTKMTVTELIRRLNHIPPEVSREGEIVTIEESGETVTITLPLSAFSDAGLSLSEADCGLYKAGK